MADSFDILIIGGGIDLRQQRKDGGRNRQSL